MLTVDLSELNGDSGDGVSVDVAGAFIQSIESPDGVPDDLAVFRFPVAGLALDGSSSTPVYALADTGANVVVAQHSVVANWRAANCVISSETVPPIPIRLGSKRITASQPLVERVLVRLRVHLEGYSLDADQWVWVWPELREPLVLSFGFLRKHELLLYMQTHISPTMAAPEEALLTDLQHMNPSSSEFTDSFVAATDSTIDEFLFDPGIVNPEFPLVDELRLALRPGLRTLLAPPDAVGITGIPPVRLLLREGVTVNDLPRQACRFVAKHLMPHLRLELDRLLSLRIIRTAIGDPPCCSPLCLAAKADGNLRMAIDYSRVNPFLRQSALPIPMLKFLFDYFRQCTWFGVFDFKDGYLRCPVHEDDKFVTTFITPYGLFQFNFLPFGFAGAPGWFSRFMYDFVLKTVVRPQPPLAVNFIDDTGVADASATVFLHKVKTVVDCMVAHNCRLKSSKCRLGFDRIPFCGYIFHHDGYGMSPSRKQGVADMPAPGAYKSLRSFVGLANFFSTFVPKLATRLTPLTNRLVGNGKLPWIWGEAEETAFQDVKQAILNCTDLAHIDPTAALTLMTDASVEGCGGVLLQRTTSPTGVVTYQIVAFVSHKFSKQARDWSTIEQEGYSIVYCVLRLEEFLLGRHFLVRTDHKNLIYILGSNIPKIIRWRLRLSEFDFAIEHIAGRDNQVADGLSRILNALSVDVDEPNLLFDDLFSQLHNAVIGHHGIARTEHMLGVVMPSWRERFPHGRARLRELCRECPVCQKLKQPERLRGPADVWHHINGARPFGSVSMDQFGPFPPDEWGNTYLQGIMCNLTRIGIGIPTKGVTAEAATFALCHWTMIYGWMDELRSDQGPAMTSDIIQSLLRLFGVKHVKVLAHHHQANGLIERRGREVKKHINAMIFNASVRKKWSMAAMIAYGISNSSRDRMLGETPNRLAMGDFNNPLDSARVVKRMAGLATVNDYVQELEQLTKQCQVASAEHLARQQAMEDSRKTRMARPHERLENGDYVLLAYPEVTIPRAPTRMHPTYRGPLVVVDASRQDVIKVVDIVTKKPLEVHVTDLHKFHAPDHILPDQLLHWALADHPDEFIIEAVTNHRLDPAKRRGPYALELQIKWLGYDETSEEGLTWEPYPKIKANAKVDQYVVAHKLPRIKEK